MKGRRTVASHGGDLVAGIERRQRGLDAHQQNVPAEIANSGKMEILTTELGHR